MGCGHAKGACTAARRPARRRARRSVLPPAARGRERDRSSSDRLADLCCGDPSIDLSLIWSLLPPEGRAAFLAAYGPRLTTEQLLCVCVCVCVLALFICAALAVYAQNEGQARGNRRSGAGVVPLCRARGLRPEQRSSARRSKVWRGRQSTDGSSIFVLRGYASQLDRLAPATGRSRIDRLWLARPGVSFTTLGFLV